MRLRKALRRIALVLGAIVVAAALAVVSFFVWLDTEGGRLWARDAINRLLEDTFVARVSVDRIHRITPWRLEAGTFQVVDDDGSVLLVDGIVADTSLIDAAISWMLDDRLTLTIVRARLEHVDVSLDTTPSGALRLVEAFEPRMRKPKDEAPPAVIIASAEIIHGWAHGNPGILVDAEVDDVAGTVTVVDGVGVTVHRAKILTRAMPRDANLLGALSGELTVPEGEALSAAVQYVHEDEQLPLTLDASMKDERFAATVVVGPVSGAVVAPFLPFALRDSITARVHAAGDLRQVAGSYELALIEGPERPGAALRGTATLTIEPELLRARADLHAERVDVSAFLPAAPESRLDAWAKAQLEIPKEGELSGNVSLRTGGQLGDYPVPAVQLRGALRGSDLDVEGVVDEPGAHARVAARIGFGGRVPRLDGRAAIDLANVKHASLEARRIQATLRARGPLDALFVQASASMRDASVADIAVSEAALRVAGPLRRLDAELDASLRWGGVRVIRASATAFIDGRVELRELAVDARGPKTNLTVRAPLVAIAGGSIALPDAEVRGLGKPLRGSLAVAGDRIDVSAKGQDLSLEAIGDLLGAGEDIHGDLDVDVALQRTRGALRGRVGLWLDDGKWDSWGPLRAAVDTTLAGRRVEGNVWLMLGPYAQVAIDIDPLSFGGDPFTADGLRRGTGKVFALISGDASKLRELACELGLGNEWLEEHKVTGRVTASARVRRDVGQQPPSVSVELATDDLHIVRRDSGDDFVQPLDLDIDARVEALTGKADIDMRLSDRLGSLLRLEASADLPVGRFWQNGAPSSVMATAAAWRDVPFRLRAHVPGRRVSDLPLLAEKGILGRVDLDVSLDGTASRPRGRVTLGAYRLRSRRQGFRMPLDGRLELDLEPTRTEMELEVGTRRRTMLRANARLDARLADILGGNVPDWELNGDVELRALRLKAFRPLRDRRLGGTVTGWVSVARLNRANMRVVGELAADSLEVGDAEFENARLGIRAEADQADVVVRLASPEDGYGRIEATVPTTWTPRGPVLREGARIALLARKLQLAAIHPLVENIFGELRGRLDARATLDFSKGAPRFSGSLEVTRGRWQVAGYGETFTDTTAKVTFQRNGTVRLHELRARSLSGEFIASGRARFDGVDLESARVDVRIPEKQPLPVVVQGKHFGDAWGRLRLGARRRGQRLHIDIGVPRLELELAKQLPTAGRKLERSKNIQIGVRNKRRFTPVPLSPPGHEGPVSPFPLRLNISLGDVVIRKSRSVFVQLTGKPYFEVNHEIRGYGKIRVVSGSLEVQGKELEIVRGLLTFNGRDATNPQVSFSAKWVAPDGTEIFAEFIGPVNGGKVTLRSNPPLSRDQIIAALLFGSPEGYAPASQTAGEANRASQAVGLGGAIVAKGLNEAISKVTSLDVGVHVDTSRSTGPAPELEVALTRTLSLQFSHLLGVPPPGETQDRNFATLSWRFFAEWVFETTVGDQGGTSLDLLWQHRY